MPQEQSPTTNERKYPRWEMQMSWGDLLVAALERKMISESDPNYDRRATCVRSFQAQNGDVINVHGSAGEDTDSVWYVFVTPPTKGENDQPHVTTSFLVYAGEGDGNSYGVNIAENGASFPVSFNVVEALFTEVVTMTPTSDTEYRISPDRG
jgi:hypothetical protein